MSDLKVLDEIEQRLKAATPGPWFISAMDGRHGIEMWIETEWNGGLPIAKVCGTPIDRELLVNAPADLALLAKTTRELIEWGERVVAHCEQMNFKTREEDWIAEELAEIRCELEAA